MRLLRSHSARPIAAIAYILFASLTASAQLPGVPARVTQAVDVERLETLHGNTHPLARPEFDQGAAPDSLPMERMLLVLQRSAEQETALRKLLDEQQVKSSPNYHMWLTPEQFGQQFGPAQADIQAVADWLTSQGFEVNQVAKGRTIIEFSGTAGTVRQALHTEIHKFAMNGEEHWANASDPQIPAALQPVVAGFASLNNFPRKAMMKRVGAFSRSKTTGAVTPLFTVPTSNGNYYVLGPTDFATIYNVLPLWQGSPAINGAGQTIAIVGSSNINIQDVRNFRNLFGLAANDPQIILNGVDPGVTGGDDESEADLDTEWSGAVATNATIDLVVSETTEATFGADLSAVYVVDNNLAPVLSASYGACEAALGVGGNAFYNTLWGQGAAQGITILVAAGDDGSAGCDYSAGEAAAEFGLMVSGTASTPFDVAVGGTDFNDVGTWSSYWSSNNNTTTMASALSYIPETTWNDSCARTGLASNCASAGSDTPTGIDLLGGGGGASNCVAFTSTATSIGCMGGYSKPPWQSGTGVPDDGARDLPDVSLFASNGMNNTFYVICQADALPAGEISCNSSYGQWSFQGAGGTSASTPTFAGIMALVNQKTAERQGNANYVLYSLAAQNNATCTSNASMASTANTSSCIFYDVVTGNNSMACMGGTPNCSSLTPGDYGLLEVGPPIINTLAWDASAGYDLATGLGSVNAANLVNNWTSGSFKPTTTNLAGLSPKTLAHGQPVNFTVNVAPASGSGVLTGNVSLIAQTGGSPTNVTGIGPFTLSGGSVTNSTTMLPGGSYGVTAHYAGNGTYGASDSTPPVQVTVSPEGSQTKVALLMFDPTSGLELNPNANTAPYGSPSILRADVTNNSTQDCFSAPYACPTGQVTLTDNGQPVDLGTYKLNSQGYAEDQLVALPLGSNSVAASYSGDNSYNPSTSPTDTISITKAPTTITISGLPSVIQGGTVNTNFTVSINTQSAGVAPTGYAQILEGTTPIGTGGDYVGHNGSAAASASMQAFLTMSLPPGSQESITAQYPGDSNYLASTSAPFIVTVTDFSVSASPASINIPAPGESASTTITLTPLYGFTGQVNLPCNPPSNAGISCTISPSSIGFSGSSPVTATLTVTTSGSASGVVPAHQVRVPPSSPLPVGWRWTLAGLLVLSTLTTLAARRGRAAGLLFVSALLLVGIWVACGGGGGGGGSTPPPAPVVGFSAPSLTFGQQTMGTTSAAQSVTLSNTGNASLNISSMALTGTNSGDFAQTSNCGGSVAAGANCKISVTFTPSANGPRTASLALTDDASSSPQKISLTGTGMSPVVNLAPATLTFGQENLNMTSTPLTAMLSNSSNTSVSISSIAIGGNNPSDFAETNTCGKSIAAGANCTISVAFTPWAAGSRTAVLAVTDNAAGSPQAVNLAGTGVHATPAGTYAVVINAQSGSDQHALNVSVVVQ